jgi:hypothetical protein
MKVRRLMMVKVVVIVVARLRLDDGREDGVVVDLGLGEELAAAEGREALAHLGLEAAHARLLRAAEAAHLLLHRRAQLLVGRARRLVR